MSEINSIAQGTYTLGQTSATTYQAGPGISITQPSEGTVRISNDETVLWSGASALTAMNGSANAITLTESLYNFGTVAVYCRPLAAHNELKIVEFTPDSSTEGFDWLSWFKGGSTGSNGAIRFGGAFMQYTTDKLWAKTNEFFQLSVTSAGVSMQTNQNVITKVIGINRISGSNT